MQEGVEAAVLRADPELVTDVRGDGLRVGEHIYVRFAPDPEDVAAAMTPSPSRTLVAELMRQLVHRIADRRTVYVTLLELRLEAARRPALRETLTRRVRADLDSNVQFHNDAGLPGGRTTVLLLYLAMSGVLVEYLTLPGVLAKEGSLEELIDAAVRQIVPVR